MRDFFSREYDFSFKDLLAIVFSGFFLFYAYKALNSEQALDLVDTLVPLIGIILDSIKPTKLSELTNDSNFATMEYVDNNSGLIIP